MPSFDLINATHVLFVANSGIPAKADEVLQNQVKSVLGT